MDLTFLDNYLLMARYNYRINQCLYAACEVLTDAQRNADRGAFFKSIHCTLMYLVLTDKMLLTSFASQGVSVAALPLELIALPEGSDYSSNLHPDWEDLKQTPKGLDEVIEVWLQEMSSEFLSGTMHYANLKGV